MRDTHEHGRRPFPLHPHAEATSSGDAIRVCPGIGLEQQHDSFPDNRIQQATDTWGPVVEIWEGWAVDPDVRYQGSSGGLCTALSLYCLEQASMEGVVHIAARKDTPYLNETVFSTTRDALISATGSRYAPASPCEGLSFIERASGPCVFIGKPCDVAAAHNATALRTRLQRNLGLTIAFFCAGTPTTEGTFELLRRMGIDHPDSIVGLRYRGNGWPGNATVTLRTESGIEQRELTYEQAWGDILTRHKQWRCNLCADHSGEFADIAVADAWQTPPDGTDPGRSLVLIRTQRGHDIFHSAQQAGYVKARRVTIDDLNQAQPDLRKARAAVWGRSLALRLMRLATPRYKRLPMLHLWLSELSTKEKVQSILGTIRRRRRRVLNRPVSPQPLELIPSALSENHGTETKLRAMSADKCAVARPAAEHSIVTETRTWTT